MANSKYPQQRSDAFITREVDGELLVLDQENEKVHQLNSSACFIWKACSGDFSVDEIASQMQAEFKDVAATTLQKDLKVVLEQLQSLRLIDYTDLRPGTEQGVHGET